MVGRPLLPRYIRRGDEKRQNQSGCEFRRNTLENPANARSSQPRCMQTLITATIRAAERAFVVQTKQNNSRRRQPLVEVCEVCEKCREKRIKARDRPTERNERNQMYSDRYTFSLRAMWNASREQAMEFRVRLAEQCMHWGGEFTGDFLFTENGWRAFHDFLRIQSYNAMPNMLLCRFDKPRKRFMHSPRYQHICSQRDKLLSFISKWNLLSHEWPPSNSNSCDA